MLSALEHGLVTDIVRCNKNIHIIYQSIPDHVKRASGLTSWDHHGPWYTLSTNGDINYSGHFDDRPLTDIKKQLGRSLLYRNIFGINRADNDYDIDLFTTIVKKSKDISALLFPESSFDIIYWDVDVDLSAKALKRLRTAGLSVHPISDILPKFVERRTTEYTLSPHDGHPSALAHRLIAKFVADSIVQ
jgi:hypothetical protein